MALLDLLKHRKSVRDFLDRPVEREKIMLCLEAARLAPSACNSQPWKFIVVDDRQLKNKLCLAAFSSVYSINSFCKKAPVIVVIVSEKSKFLARIGGMFRGTKYYLIVNPNSSKIGSTRLKQGDTSGNTKGTLFYQKTNTLFLV